MRTQSTEVTLINLQEIMDARENRSIRQKVWLERWRAPVVSLTLVSPGPEKFNTRYTKCMNEAIRSANALFSLLGNKINSHEVFWLATGPEALWSLVLEPQKLKQHLVWLEDEHQLGRLWDFDVICPQSGGISRTHVGLPGRTCLICGNPAHACSRSRAHTLHELTSRIEDLIDGFTYCAK